MSVNNNIGANSQANQNLPCPQPYQASNSLENEFNARPISENPQEKQTKILRLKEVYELLA